MFFLASKYNQRICTLHFHITDLIVPIIKTKQELKEMVANRPLDLMTIPTSDHSLARKIRHLLIPTADNIYIQKTIEQIALELNITASELRKKLNAESTLFRKIEENVRRDMACTRLRGSHASIESIAEEIGYKETRSFYRAFKSWTGYSPR